MEAKLKGSVMAKVAGILMIIGGSINIIISLIAIAGAGVLIALGGEALLGGLIYVALIALILGAAAELTAGIIAVKNNNNAAKAQTIIISSAVVICLSVVYAIVEAIAGGSVNAFSVIIGAVLPVLAIIAGCMNKQ